MRDSILLSKNRLSAPALGVVLMLINTIALAVLDASVKVLRLDLPAPLITFLYKFSLFIIILPWVFSSGVKALRTKMIWFHVLRALLSVGGSLCFFQGLAKVPMADAAALENVQYLIICTFGMFFFREEVTAVKIIAIVVGFIGATVVVNPGAYVSFFTNEVQLNFNGHYWFIIAAICFWALNTIIVKILGKTENNRTQMFYVLFFASIFAALAALLKWESIEIMGHYISIIPGGLRDYNNQYNIAINHVILLLAMGAAYFVHGIAYFNALKSDLSVVVPFRYTKLIFSGLIGYFIFSETQSTVSYFGYALIILSAFMLLKWQIIAKQKSFA